MSNVQRAIAVLGTTGSGKSSLAVKLAQSLSSTFPSTPSPVLSCDSIQLYRGLDVITNKATPQEQNGTEHWGLSLSEPWEPSWELGRFINAATSKISSLPPGSIPVLAGGTHYWLQHLLFPPPELDLSRETERRERWAPKGPPPPNELQGEWKTLLDTFHADAVYPKGRADEDWRRLSSWKLLEMVDPKEAGRWHWRDTRKVVTALQRWYDSATPPSPSSTAAGLKPRFQHTLLFWVYEPLPLLRPRLDSRVDTMVSRGLLSEIRDLRTLASERNVPTTGGIFEAIGFREFIGVDLDDEAQVAEALRRVKRNTHAYAKTQMKWIRNQLLPAVREAGRRGDVQVLVVPSSGEGAVEAMNRWLRGERPDTESLYPGAHALLAPLRGEGDVPTLDARQTLHARRICEVCSTPENPVSVRESQWSAHLKSKKHRREKRYGDLSREEWIERQKELGKAKAKNRQT